MSFDAGKVSARVESMRKDRSMNKDRVRRLVEELDAIDADDGETGHADADQVLLKAVPPEVREAYVRVMERAGFWAYA